MPLFTRLRPRERGITLLGIVRTLLATAVFLTPLFFLPGLNDIVELPKSAIFLTLTLLSAILWMVSWVVIGEVRWRPVQGRWFFVALALVIILSSIFSVHRVSSLLGTSGYTHHSVAVFLGFMLFVFLLTQVIENEREVAFFASVLWVALGLASLLAFLQFSGIFPFRLAAFRASGFFVTGNTGTSLAVLMAVTLPLSITMFRQLQGKLWRLLGALGIILPTLVLLIIDAPAAWMAVLVGVVVTVVFASLRRLTKFDLIISTIVIVLAIVGLLFPTGSWFGNRVTPDARLDISTSWSVVRSTLAKYPIVGSGPTTFLYDFVQFSPASFNASPLADFRFIKASDEGLQILATLGVLGALSLLGLIIYVLFGMMNRGEEIARRSRESWRLVAAIFGVWIGTAAAFLFAPSTFATFAVFWMSLGFLLVILRRNGTLHSSRQPLAKLTATLNFLLFTIVFVVTAIWSTKLVLADRGLAQVLAAVRRTEDVEKIIQRLDRVTRLNNTAALPFLYRAQARLTQAQLLAQRQSSPENIKKLVAQAAADGEAAVSRDPKNPAYLESLADLYKTIASLGADANNQIISAYERASKLEPKNARTLVNLGQANYFAALALIRKDNPDEATTADANEKIRRAQAAFEAAIEVNPGNVDASFGLVLVDEAVGEKDRALSRLNELVQKNSDSAALWYELGLRYADRDDRAKAKEAFANAARLQPQFAQAHWQLGLIAEKEKDTATARREFELVRQLDPRNTEVNKKLEALPKE